MISTNELIQATSNQTKAYIESGLFVFAGKFLLDNDFKFPESPATESALKKYYGHKPLNKAEVVLISYSVFQYPEIFHAFMQSLSSAANKLMELLVWEESVTTEEAEILLKEPLLIAPARQYGQYTLKPEFFIFDVRSFYYTYGGVKPNLILRLPPFLKKILSAYYPHPLHYDLLPLDSIPETAQRFNAENLILQEIPRILSYYMQEGIKYNAAGKPLDVTLAKLQRNCAIIEFFPEDRTFSKVRSMLLAGLLYNFKVSNISIDNVGIIKELLTTRYPKMHSAQYILTQVKGWLYVREDEYNKNVENTFFEIIKLLPLGKWISAENFVEFIKYRAIEVKPVSPYALNNRLYYEIQIKTTVGSYMDKKNAGGNAKKFVNDPFIKGTCFLLAAAGFLEIAYTGVNTEEFGKTYWSPYDGLQYIRLTSLGAYVMGASATYEPAEALRQNKLDFFKDSLLILAEGDMGVLEIMLTNYAEKAGSNRFKITHAQFLKGCTTIKDIDNKINLFKKTVAANLPPFWEQQFKTWRQNALITNKDLTATVFTIATEAKDLHKLIAQDPTLKTLVLKAEQFRVIVPAKNLAGFKSRMKELGYLVE